MAILFARSAAKHGISADRARYVLRHHGWAFDIGDNVTLHIGPDANGVDLEVGSVEDYRRHLTWPR